MQFFLQAVDEMGIQNSPDRDRGYVCVFRYMFHLSFGIFEMNFLNSHFAVSLPYSSVLSTLYGIIS